MKWSILKYILEVFFLENYHTQWQSKFFLIHSETILLNEIPPFWQTQAKTISIVLMQGAVKAVVNVEVQVFLNKYRTIPLSVNPNPGVNCHF
jgi:hypothetical protein